MKEMHQMSFESMVKVEENRGYLYTEITNHTVNSHETVTAEKSHMRAKRLMKNNVPESSMK